MIWSNGTRHDGDKLKHNFQRNYWDCNINSSNIIGKLASDPFKLKLLEEITHKNFSNHKGTHTFEIQNNVPVNFCSNVKRFQLGSKVTNVSKAN